MGAPTLHSEHAGGESVLQPLLFIEMSTAKHCTSRGTIKWALTGARHTNLKGHCHRNLRTRCGASPYSRL